VVSIEPEPDKLANTSAAAHIVVDRGIFGIIFKRLGSQLCSRGVSNTEFGFRDLERVRGLPQSQIEGTYCQDKMLNECT
jgi:hypothetical protein